MIQSSLPFSRIMRPRHSVKRLIVGIIFLVLTNISNSTLAAGRTGVSLDHRGSLVTGEHALHAFAQYVEEASRRFLIPSPWIWAVMRVESAGDSRALSNKGAMGLMQIMPDTWTMLRQQHDLGDDPCDPRDNILAGTGYLRELHHRYGNEGFLAAYNAGPRRYEEHLSGRRSLPAETIDYVSKVSRMIGLGAPSNGFLTAHSGSVAAESDLFVCSEFESSSDQEADDNRSQNQVSVSLKYDQRVVDLSAIIPQTSGLFVRLSDRRQLNQD
jgi:hypothetical protein